MTAPLTPAQALAALPLGRIPDEPIAAYHAAPAVSVSKLKVFRHSPALYHGRFISGSVSAPEATPALLFGSAAGVLILEGRDAFNAQYYVVPQGIGKQRVGDKAIREQLAANNPGKLALSFDDFSAIERMNTNVQKHQFAAPLLAACKPEITWRVKGDTFHVQVRTDAWSDEGCELTQGSPFIADLKTIPALPDDEPETISKQIAEYWYHGQAYVYREIVSTVMKYPAEFRPPFFFIFVEKAEPYAVRVVELDDAALDLAFKQVKDTLERLKDCHRHNRWPLTWADTWEKKVPQVELPRYYIRREMAEESSIW
jgi:hypothetical protein